MEHATLLAHRKSRAESMRPLPRPDSTHRLLAANSRTPHLAPLNRAHHLHRFPTCSSPSRALSLQTAHPALSRTRRQRPGHHSLGRQGKGFRKRGQHPDAGDLPISRSKLHRHRTHHLPPRPLPPPPHSANNPHPRHPHRQRPRRSRRASRCRGNDISHTLLPPGIPHRVRHRTRRALPRRWPALLPSKTSKRALLLPHPPRGRDSLNGDRAGRTLRAHLHRHARR